MSFVRYRHTDKREGVEAAERLVSGLEVDLRVVVGRGPVHGVLVEVAMVDVDVDAADRVDRPGEAREVHVDQVVYMQAGELLDRLQGQLRAAIRVRVVELADPESGDADLQVTR